MSDYDSCQELNLVPQELSYEHCTVWTEFLYIVSLQRVARLKKKISAIQLKIKSHWHFWSPPRCQTPVRSPSSVSNLVPETLDLVPGLSFSCWFSSWGFLVLSLLLARLFSSHLVPGACFRNCLTFNVVKIAQVTQFQAIITFLCKILSLLPKKYPKTP